jgi:hypothetical protein
VSVVKLNKTGNLVIQVPHRVRDKLQPESSKPSVIIKPALDTSDNVYTFERYKEFGGSAIFLLDS